MSEPETTEPPTLLVVDDEVAVRRSLGRLLSRQGFTVIEASTLDEALSAADQHDIHVALVDCPLKGTDGTAAIQQLNEASPITEIIALTEMGSSETAFHVMRAGSCDYYEKPISDWHRFFQVINKAIEVLNERRERDDETAFDQLHILLIENAVDGSADICLQPGALLRLINLRRLAEYPQIQINRLRT